MFDLIDLLLDADVDGAAGGGTTEEETTVETKTGAEGGTDGMTASELKRARSEAAQFRKKAADLEKWKTEKEAAEAQAETEKATKQGEYQKLYESTKAKLEKAESATTELETLRAQVKEMQDEQRAELLERLPKNLRKEFEGEDVTLAELKRAVKLAGTVVPPGKSVASEKAGEGDASRKSGKPTFDELDALQKAGDVEGYQKRLAEMRKPSNNSRILF